MGLNIITQTTSGYQFENRNEQRKAANEIFKRQGAAVEKNPLDRIMSNTIFNSDGMVYSNAQLSIIKAASQIDGSGNLKETLKYLKSHPAKKVAKQPVLGELWDLFAQEQKEYKDIYEFEIDFSAENIFAA